MREITYRIWFPKMNRHAEEAEALVHLMNVFTGGLVCNVEELDYITDKADYYTESGYILEQYTGLKDTNGKEIYEGDIVSVLELTRDEIYENAAIFFADGCFSFVSDKRSDCIMNLGEVASKGAHEGSHCCEIIGNIHQNEELENVAR